MYIIAATFIIFLIQTPVLFWNLNNELVSFSFHLNQRLDQEKDISTVFQNTVGFLLGVLLAFSPFFIVNLKNNFFAANYFENKKNFYTLSKIVLILSLASCIFLSFFTTVLYYWLTPATILLTPFLAKIIKAKIWQYLHILYGIVVSLILFFNTSIYPINVFFGNVDRETAILFGWNKIVREIEKEKIEQDTEKVVFSDYRLGSLYIFHSGDFKADVVMEKRKTQFDVWREKENLFGRNTLIIADDDFPVGKKIQSRFESIEFLRDIEIHTENKLVKKYYVFLGTNK